MDFPGSYPVKSNLPRNLAPDRHGRDAVETALADLLHEGQSLALLQELHILTRDGRINQDSRRKLKQVNHLYQFIAGILQELPNAGADAIVADHGAGKSYLGFVLYDLFFKARATGAVIGIESRAELVARAQTLAQRLGFVRMRFHHLLSQDAIHAEGMPDTVSLVTALHACDTATDAAIDFGLAKQAQAMVLVPCCQAEVARMLNAGKALSLRRSSLTELWRQPLHTRELGSHITNVLRCLYLEACGYRVTVTELVGWEHSLKNELILARYRGEANGQAAARLRELLDAFGLRELQATRFPHLNTRLPAMVAQP